ASPAQFGRHACISSRRLARAAKRLPYPSIVMVASHRRSSVFRVVALAMLSAASVAQAAMTVMHGFADYTSALLWVQTDRPGPVEITVTPEGGGDARVQNVEAEAANDYVLTARVPGLS